MFVQVIQGQVSDAEQVHAAFDRWAQELAPSAEGWLGSTAGVTDDGTLVAIARFDSEAAARRNSSRPEQDRWWSETSKLFTKGATFHDSSDVMVDTPRDPSDAHFVQVIQGRATDPARARELMAEDSGKWADYRPDMLGSVEADYEGNAYTVALYFTNEAEAREGEQKEAPPEFRERMAEMEKLNAEPPKFFDLKQPWLYSPS